MDTDISIQGPRFELRLSHWDRRFPPMYSQRLLVFGVEHNNDQQIILDQVRALQRALQATVKDLPFLASCIVPYSVHQPWLRDIRTEGAARLEIRDLTDRAELDFKELSARGFPPRLLDATALCAYPSPYNATDKVMDGCRMRATFIRNGLILAFQVSHIIGDGLAITHMLRKFAQHMRDCLSPNSSDNVAELGQSEPFQEDRSRLVCGHGGKGDIQGHPSWTTAPFPRDVEIATRSSDTLVAAVYRISASSMCNLKTLATDSVAAETTVSPRFEKATTEPRITTHDTIAALL